MRNKEYYSNDKKPHQNNLPCLKEGLQDDLPIKENGILSVVTKQPVLSTPSRGRKLNKITNKGKKDTYQGRSSCLFPSKGATELL